MKGNGSTTGPTLEERIDTLTAAVEELVAQQAELIEKISNLSLSGVDFEIDTYEDS